MTRHTRIGADDGGYAGRALWIDLTAGTADDQALDMEYAREFIGGAGLNYRLLRDLLSAGVNPLGPEAPLLLGAGPLVGTPVPSAAKFQATAKFPHPADATGRKFYVGSAVSGGRRFGLNLKHSGYDVVVITGRASRPVVLVVGPDGARLEPAADLWGKADLYETTDALSARYPGCGVVAIGAAGENQVRFSFAITDKTSSLGRNGLGAVFGAKNLKAVVTLPGGSLAISHPARLVRNVTRMHEAIRRFPRLKEHQEIGLHASWSTYRQTMSPGLWSKAEWDLLYGPQVAHEAVAENLPCTGCSLACRSAFRVSSGPHAGELTHTGTFLHLATIGQTSGMRDWREVAVLQDLCNRAGMSVVEFRGIIRFLMATGAEDREVQALGLSDDSPGYWRLLEAIIERQGVGEAAAEGWWALSERMGADARDYVMQIKGAACTYDARQTRLDAPRFSMITNPRGAMHGQGHSRTSTPLQPPAAIRNELDGMGATAEQIGRVLTEDDVNIPRLTKHVQDAGLAFDSLGVCVMYRVFGLFNLDVLAESYSAATGVDVDAAELREAGERGFNLLKQLNAREGFTRADDTFPALWFADKQTPDGLEVLTDYYGRRRITAADVEALLDEYYDERGWEPETGLPTTATLARLGLEPL